jgi:Zn finger protein HypA/HybF involved in hydrogenase expression
MHEMSVAMEICRIVDEQYDRDAGTLVTVGVELGDDAGLEPANLEFCLETLLAQPPFGGAKLIFDRKPGDVLRVSYLELDDGH